MNCRFIGVELLARRVACKMSDTKHHVNSGEEIEDIPVEHEHQPRGLVFPAQVLEQTTQLVVVEKILHRQMAAWPAAGAFSEMQVAEDDEIER